MIANYNVQPDIVIEVNTQVATEKIAKTELVESTTKAVIHKGFKAGDIKPLRPDTKTINFHGLKLNRMGHMKEELSRMQINNKDASFCIKITIDDSVVYSEPFKFVSSFNQLPKDFQDKRNGRATKTSSQKN